MAGRPRVVPRPPQPLEAAIVADRLVLDAERARALAFYHALAAGYSMREIAAALGGAPSHTHVGRIARVVA